MGGGHESRTEFALVLFSGLILFNFFAECLNRAPNLILSYPNYVKNVVFPLEILPWALLGSALFHAATSLAVWLLAHLLLVGLPPLSAVLAPLMLVPLDSADTGHHLVPRLPGRVSARRRDRRCRSSPP